MGHCADTDYICKVREDATHAAEAAVQAASDLAAATDPTNPAFWNKVGNAVNDVGKAAQKTVENFLADPIPMLATVALTAMGVPAPVANFLVNMAQGKSPEDAAKGAVISYVSGMAGSAISGTVAGAIGSAADIGISNILASGATGTVAALLAGKNFEDALAAGAEAAVTGMVVKGIKDAGVDPGTIEGKMLIDSAKAAMGAIYKGKDIATAVGAAATGSLIASSIENLTGLAATQKSVLQQASINAKNAKAEAAAIRAKSKYLQDSSASANKIKKDEEASAVAVASAQTLAKNKENEIAGLGSATSANSIMGKQAADVKDAGSEAAAAKAAAALRVKDKKAYDTKYSAYPTGEFQTAAQLQDYKDLLTATVASANKVVTDAAQPRKDMVAEMTEYNAAVQKAYDEAKKMKEAHDTIESVGKTIGEKVVEYEKTILSKAEKFNQPIVDQIVKDAKAVVAGKAAAELKVATDIGFTSAADMKAAGCCCARILCYKSWIQRCRRPSCGQGQIGSYCYSSPMGTRTRSPCCQFFKCGRLQNCRNKISPRLLRFKKWIHQCGRSNRRCSRWIYLSRWSSVPKAKNSGGRRV